MKTNEQIKREVEAAMQTTHPDERNEKLKKLGFVSLAQVRRFLAKFSDIPLIGE